MSALRTFFINWLVVGGELAFWIGGAAVENIAAPGFLFHDVALFAIRALHPDQVLLDVFAIGISAARGKFAKAPVTQHHIASALRAFFFQRNIGDLLALIQPAGGFAIRIPGARHELAEASALEHHGASAVLAVFFLRGLLQVGGIEVRQVNRIFFGEGTAIRIVFLISAAGKKRAVLSPLDDQRHAATLALFVGRLFHPLYVLHVFLGIGKVFGKFLVETGERPRPLLFALFYFIQLLFQAGGVGEVEDVGEVGDQQIGDDQANFRGNKLAADLLHILPLLDGADDGGVG